MALLSVACLGGMLWQGEREVMWDTVQMQATHTLQLSRHRRDEQEAEALYSSLQEAHARLRSSGAGAGGSGLGTATHFMQLDNFKNTQYSGEVGVGTPPQSMRVIFDTGSANFWVYTRDCKSLACQLHSTYDHRLSSTYHRDGTPLRIRYGSGSVGGRLAQDTLRLGNLEPLPNQTLGEVVNETGKAFVYGKFDGILGMAFAAIAAPGTTPVFDHLLQSKLLRNGLFSFYLPDAQRAPVVGAGGGSLLLGGVDPKFASSPFLFVKLLSPAAPKYWAVRLSGVHVDRDEPIATCATPAAGVGVTGGDTDVACRVAVDTGTSLITGPSREVRRLLQRTQVDDDCANLAELPPVTFVVAGHALTLTPAEYVLQQQRANGVVRCITGFVPLDVPPPRGPLWVFGDLFLRAYYTLFDRDQLRVGFAKARKAPGGTIAPIAAGDGWGQPHAGADAAGAAPAGAPQPSEPPPTVAVGAADTAVGERGGDAYGDGDGDGDGDGGDGYGGGTAYGGDGYGGDDSHGDDGARAGRRGGVRRGGGDDRSDRRDGYEYDDRPRRGVQEQEQEQMQEQDERPEDEEQEQEQEQGQPSPRQREAGGRTHAHRRVRRRRRLVQRERVPSAAHEERVQRMAQQQQQEALPQDAEEGEVAEEAPPLLRRRRRRRPLQEASPGGARPLPGQAPSFDSDFERRATPRRRLFRRITAVPPPDEHPPRQHRRRRRRRAHRDRDAVPYSALIET